MGYYLDNDGITHKKYEISTYSDNEFPSVIEIDVKETDPTFYTGPSLENLPSSMFPRYSIDPTFRTLLSNTKAGEICLPSGSIFVCDESDNLLAVYRQLIMLRIMSLPVCSSDKTKFFGFIDIIDIITYLTDHITLRREDSHMVEPWYSIVDIACTPCRNVMNYSGRDPTLITDFFDSVQSIIDHTSFLNYHRIIVTKTGAAESVLTQSRLLDYLYIHNMPSLLGTLGLQTVDNLKLGIRPVHSVTNGTQVIQAFKMMVREKVSGLAIVDERNRIVGNISASDLKLIGYDMELYARLFGTIADFVKRKQTNSQAAPVTVNLSTRFTDVLSLFHETKVHRIYVVDQDILVGVITLGDILTCFQSPHLAAWNTRHYRLT